MKVRIPNVPKLVICESCNPSGKKKHCLNFLNKYLVFCSCFEIGRSHKFECDSDSVLVLPT